MEVRGGKAGSEADPVQARDAAANPDTQPLGGAAPPVDEQPALGPGSLFSDRYDWERSSVPGGCRRRFTPTTGAPAAR
jgi:hypothetical protein